MLTRKLGSVLRGKATPFQLVAACVLGALLGFAPAVGQAPALYLLLAGTLLVVNANIGLSLLVAGGTRILSWLLVEVSFDVGRFLLDGPTSGIAHTIVNAPVLAWCGFEYYVVAGGQVLGLLLGACLGLLVSRSVSRFRRKMIASADNPSRLKELAAKPWARFALWLFFGGTGKKSWEEKAAKSVGNPIRIWGLALVIVVGAGLFFANRTVVPALVRGGMQKGLTQANGATVDLEGVQLDLRAGVFGLTGLALADPNALEQDLLRIAGIEADLDQVDFLRRRVHVARFEVREAASGVLRETPGVLVAGAARKKPAEPVEEGPTDLSDLSLEDVIEEVEVWQGRLKQARQWMDKLSSEKPAADEESLSERLARQAAETGWLSVVAEHLIDEAPSFRLSELEIDGLSLAALPGRVFDLRGSELSSHPWLLDTPPRLTLASRDGTIGFELDLAPASRTGGDGVLRMHWRGLSVDDALAKLKLPGGAPLRGGTLDLELDGSWANAQIGVIDLPLSVTLHDTTLTMGDIEETTISELVLPIGLRGPIDALRIHFDGATFADALVAAGRSELAKRVRGELTGKLQDKLQDELGELSERTGVELPKGLDDLEDKAKKEAQGALKDLLGGRKKKDG